MFIKSDSFEVIVQKLYDNTRNLAKDLLDDGKLNKSNKEEQRRKTISLDVGHSLKTAGKQTPDGIKEWEICDKIRDKVVKILKDYDVKFIFPDNDEGNVDEKLTTRRQAYISADADACVSLHLNAYKGKWGNHTGTEVFVDKNYTKQDMELAEAIYKRLVEYFGLKGRGIKKENWTVINQNKIPAVLVEGGFMDSLIDNPIIMSEKGQDAYARAVAEGLIEFLELKKKSNSNKTSNNSKYINNSRVKSWQTVMNKVYKCGLAVDSNFGPDCESKANKYYLYKKAIVTFRFKNDYVKWLQNRLKELGYKITVDGSFWKDTDKIVRQFQKDRGLNVDGKVGANTVKELLKQQIQQKLRHSNYMPLKYKSLKNDSRESILGLFLCLKIKLACKSIHNVV